MIDPEMVDEYGSSINFAVFDKRVLLSLQEVAQDVSQAIGKTITTEHLIDMAASGWIPLLSHADDPETGLGAPLYASSRLEFLIALERDGYSAEELRVIAEFEEQTIDNILTTDELAYIDDDLGIIIQHMDDMLRDAEKNGRSEIGVDRSGKTVTRERFEQRLCMLQRFQHEGIPERYQSTITRDAFRIRYQRELIRFYLCEQDRAKTRAGYSPYVFCVEESWHKNDGTTFFTFKAEKGVFWEPTIHSALAHAEGAIPTIRVPGFVLHGDQILSSRTLTPREYEQLWKQYDLDNYQLTWWDIQGQKHCLYCLAALPDRANDRRLYCSGRCRNTAKQKRYRQRNPDAIREAQRKYWSQFDLDGGV